MVAGLVVYFLNFFTGKSKNTKLANAWFTTHKTLLEDNFSLVGDDAKLDSESPGLIKESENMFTLWCSGRTCCEGMLVELKFIKVSVMQFCQWIFCGTPYMNEINNVS